MSWTAWFTGRVTEEAYTANLEEKYSKIIEELKPVVATLVSRKAYFKKVGIVGKKIYETSENIFYPVDVGKNTLLPEKVSARMTELESRVKSLFDETEIDIIDCKVNASTEPEFSTSIEVQWKI